MNPDHPHPGICKRAAFLLPALLFFACDKNVAWTDTKTVDRDGWSADSPVSFSMDPLAYEPDKDRDRFAEMPARAVGDTVTRLRGCFDATLSLRYADDCNTSEISLIIEQASLDTEISADTISVTLFSRDGTPAHRGRFGINETSVTLPRPITVSQGTQLNVSPLPYDTLPSGILSATLILRHR